MSAPTQSGDAAPDSVYYRHSGRLPLASRISLLARRRMFDLFIQHLAPTPATRVLDVGVTSDSFYPESNYFERLYPYPGRITAVGTEDGSHLEARYPGLTYKKVEAGAPLPFDDGAFDIVFSNAVIEHVGSRVSQVRFVSELCRVGRAFFITTPNRWFPFEHHTGVPLLHFLPAPLHRTLLRRTQYAYWASEDTLNILTSRSLRGLFPQTVAVRVLGVTIFGLTSNLVAVGHQPARRSIATARPGDLTMLSLSVSETQPAPSTSRSHTACPVCQSADLEYDFTIDKVPATSCTRCGLVFLNPSPAPVTVADASRDVYEVNLANAAARLDSLEKYLASVHGRLLLVGADDALRAEAARRGFAIVELTIAELEQGRLPPSELGCIQAAILSCALETAGDPASALASLRRLLQPNGTLMVIAPTLDSRTARVFGAHWWEFSRRNRFYFSADTLQCLLTRLHFGDPIILKEESVVSIEYLRRKIASLPSFRFRLMRAFLGLSPGFVRRRAFGALHTRTIMLVRAKAITPTPRLSVVLPVYNEQSTFETLMNSLIQKTIPGVDIEIVVIESHSTDGTRDLVLKYRDHPRVRLILEDVPRGKGHAVRQGFKEATGDVILIQDADLEYDIGDYDALVAPLLRFEQNFVIGSRHGKQGKLWKMREFSDATGLAAYFNFGHVVMLTLFNALYFQKLKDPFSMYKVFRRECLYGLLFECNRFDFDYELVIKLLRKGYVVRELPVNYKSRSLSAGKKVNMWSDPPTWIRALVKFRFSQLLRTVASTVTGDWRRMLRLLVLTTTFVAIAAFYVWTGATSGEPTQPAPELRGYYNLLTRGYLSGHLYLPTAPDPRLLALPDPYDAVANHDFRLHDAALFGDHYYLYYGPTPALTLFVPYRLATGHDLPQPIAIALFGACGLLFAWLILHRIGRVILGRPPSIPLALASLFALGFSSVIPFILRRPSHYEVAISAGYAFVFASLWMFTIGAVATRPRITILATASLLLGVAGGARFPLLGAGAVTLPIAAYWLGRGRLDSRRDQVGLVLALIVPCVICVALLGWYNYARFGSWTEFGIQYTLQGVSSKSYNMFHIQRIGYGLAYYLVVPPAWVRYFPFVRLDPVAMLPPPPYLILEPVAGILATTPMLAIIPTAIWSRTRHLSVLVVTAASLAIGTLLLLVFSASGMTMRYEVDFATFFVLAALWIWYEWVRRAATRGVLLRAATMTLLVSLVAVGTVCQLCLSFTGYFDQLNWFHNSTYEALIRWSAPIEQLLGGASVRIVSIEAANGVERKGSDSLLWLDVNRTRIRIRSDSSRTVALTATLIPGPSADSSLGGRHLRVRLNASPEAEERFFPAGPMRIPVAVDAGVTIVTLEATDARVNKVLPNGDTRVLMVGLSGLQVNPIEIEPVVQKATATSRFQNLDEYDAMRAFDGDEQTVWAAHGDRVARLMARFNTTGTVKGLVLLARETSRIEAWRSVQVDLYLKGERRGTVRVTLPTAATEPHQTINLPPTLIDGVELSFDQPVRTLPNGMPATQPGNPGYAEITFVWKH